MENNKNWVTAAVALVLLNCGFYTFCVFLFVVETTKIKTEFEMKPAKTQPSRPIARNEMYAIDSARMTFI